MCPPLPRSIYLVWLKSYNFISRDLFRYCRFLRMPVSLSNSNFALVSMCKYLVVPHSFNVFELCRAPFLVLGVVRSPSLEELLLEKQNCFLNLCLAAAKRVLLPNTWSDVQDNYTWHRFCHCNRCTIPWHGFRKGVERMERNGDSEAS